MTSHLHDFDVDGVCYGIPVEDDWTPVKDERHVSIDQTMGAARKIRYLYDFGDNWDHDIVLEKTSSTGDVETPDCIGGRSSGC